MTDFNESPEVRVLAEAEGIRQLILSGCSHSDIARFIRAEAADAQHLFAAPSSMRCVQRLMLAGALRHRADLTPDPSFANLIADALWYTALGFLLGRLRTIIVESVGLDRSAASGAFAQLLLEELGPEVFEHMPNVADR